MFIREVIKAQKQVLLIPRPRRFGKTMNIRMLKYFFEKDKPEYPKLFKGLNIEKAEKDVLDRMGKYPVIFLSFKDAKASNWDLTYKYIINEIIKEYSYHDYLLQKDVLKQNEKNDYINIINRSADESIYGNSLKNLSEYLHRYHQTEVVILVDEYDTPIQAGYNKKFYEEVISFMRNLLSGAYKDNVYLYKGVLTGILRVSRESIFTGLNNLGVYTILEPNFSDKFGFTEEEVKQITTDLNIPEKFENIKRWYDGYTMGKKKDMYNPWSILNYAVDYETGFKPYWVNTSSDELLKDKIKDKNNEDTRLDILKLINGETITKEIHENFVFPDLDTNIDLVWTLLTFSGYLTVVEIKDINLCKLQIPNYELKYVFKNIILHWFNNDIKITRTLLIDTANYLVTNQLDKFAEGFKRIIGDTFSYYDTAGTPEKVYQAYTLGLLAILTDDYIIRSNRESGNGKYDILLLPKQRSSTILVDKPPSQHPTGVVIEIKRIKRKKGQKIPKERINEELKNAMKQIEDNQYYKELIDHGITNIIKLPIVFVGKEAFFLKI
jgi:hypothetical protein